jgi:hypothetical protein
MKKKFTIIIIRDKRRIGSFEISTSLLIIALSVMVGLFLLSTIFFIVHNYDIKEMSVKIESANGQMTSANQKPENVSQDINRHRDKVSEGSSMLSTKLTIENFKASYDTTKKLFRYKFLLKNHTENAAISGYIFVILTSVVPGATPPLVYPKTALNDEIPANFKEGDPFSISKYKIVANHISVRDTYDSVLIYVFLSDGNLVLKESFDIRNS